MRIPAGNCGLYGVKTTRGLVPVAEEGWEGLSVLGPLGPTPADAAAMLDVMAGEDRYLAATRTDPGRLRIALSWRTPLGKAYMVAERKAAVRRAAEQLRALGHEVVETDPPLGMRPLPQFLTRYLRGVAGDVDRLPHEDWLEPRSRRIAALGRRVPDRLLRWARAAEADLRARMDGFFQDFDLVLQPGITGPPFRIGRFHGSGLARTWLGVTIAIPYFPLWNVLGYPVVAVPIGVDAAGLPIGVQLGGPEFSETTLLALAGQYARAHPPARAGFGRAPDGTSAGRPSRLACAACRSPRNPCRSGSCAGSVTASSTGCARRPAKRSGSRPRGGSRSGRPSRTVPPR